MFISREQTRQAVVIIHGIGEQRPLDTLRSFVRGKRPNQWGRKKAAGYDGVVSSRHTVTAAQDTLRGRTDQRRMMVTWDHNADLPLWIGELDPDARKHVKHREANTDFFEFYWAFHFRDTTWAHLRAWVIPLVTRRRSSVTDARLRGPDLRFPLRWLTYAAMLALTIILGLGGGGAYDIGRWDWIGLVAVVLFLVSIGWSLGLMTLFRVLAFIPLMVMAYAVGRMVDEGMSFGVVIRNLTTLTALTLAVTGISGFFLKGLGDAGRYLSATPDNVEESEAIRAKAVELLERLHSLEKSPGVPLYERVVVVGHSLGSVIAYDAVRYLWAKRNTSLLFPPPNSRMIAGQSVGEVERVTARIKELNDQIAKLNTQLAIKMRKKKRRPLLEQLGERRVELEEQRPLLTEAKARLFDQMRDGVGATKQRWIISDLVTLGSPLTYAQLMMARSYEEFLDRRKERFYAADPPNLQAAPQGAPRRMRYSLAATAELGERSVLHQAACFSVVKWTNMYFDSDVVGGPLSSQFGSGVEDVKLPVKGTRMARFLSARASHSHYWREPRWRWHKANLEGFKESRRRLGHIIERPPVVIVRCPEKPTAEVVARLVRVLASGKSDTGIPVRLLVGPKGPSPVGLWLPGSPRIRLTHRLAERVLAFLPDGSEVHVAVSPEIREPVE